MPALSLAVTRIYNTDIPAPSYPINVPITFTVFGEVDSAAALVAPPPSIGKSSDPELYYQVKVLLADSVLTDSGRQPLDTESGPPYAWQWEFEDLPPTQEFQQPLVFAYLYDSNDPEAPPIASDGGYSIFIDDAS